MTEPFPTTEGELDESVTPQSNTNAEPSPSASNQNVAEPTSKRNREDTGSSSSVTERLRSASKKFNESIIPSGMWDATGSIASGAPSVTDIRRGAFNSDGWSAEGQVQEHGRKSLGRRGSSQSTIEKDTTNSGTQRKSRTGTGEAGFPVIHETGLAPITSGMQSDDREDPKHEASSSANQTQDTLRASSSRSTADSKKVSIEAKTTPFENGYEFPPKHKWTQTTVMGLKGFWKFFLTPLGFLVVVYGLNVVAWGGMLFLLLCDASPAMCHPTCNDIQSPRRIWIETDSQILNALFCVTGFGLIPWRFRDLYHLLNYRIFKTEEGLTRLAGIHRSWFRLEGSQNLPISLGPENIEEHISDVPKSSVPVPLKSIPDAPLTGHRAPPTKVWKLDFVIWAYVWNTFLQGVLSGFMWGLNRYKRPSWSTGLFVALACIIAAAGGIMVFVEGKHVKSIEGVPVSEEDKKRLARDRELGITHYNNINDEKPKEKKEKKHHHGKKDDVELDESPSQNAVEEVR